MAHLQPVIANLKGLAQVAIEECLSVDYPDEWGIADQDRDAAIKRVLIARDKIEEILKDGNPTL
jgi:hypothetical protein